MLTGGEHSRWHNPNSAGPPVIVGQWGLVTDDMRPLGEGHLYHELGSEGDPWRVSIPTVQFSWLFTTDDRSAVGALKILGGRQLFWDGISFDGSSFAGRETFAWGSRGPVEQEVYSSAAWDGDWNPASIRLYVASPGSELPGFELVGVRQMARDRPSHQPYVTIMEWGDTSAQEQFIGIGEAWSPNYGWGFSQISLFLTPV